MSAIASDIFAVFKSVRDVLGPYSILVTVSSVSVAFVLGSLNLFFMLRFRLRDDRWSQIQKAEKLVDDLYSDPYSLSALRMTDGSLTSLELLPEYRIDYNVPIFKGVKQEDIEAALTTEIGEDEDIALASTIAHCFDTLFYHFNRMEIYVSSGLVSFEQIRWPLRYYIPHLHDDKRLFLGYMRKIKYKKCEKFLSRFGEWRDEHS